MANAPPPPPVRPRRAAACVEGVIKRFRRCALGKGFGCQSATPCGHIQVLQRRRRQTYFKRSQKHPAHPRATSTLQRMQKVHPQNKQPGPGAFPPVLQLNSGHQRHSSVFVSVVATRAGIPFPPLRLPTLCSVVDTARWKLWRGTKRPISGSAVTLGSLTDTKASTRDSIPQSR